MILIAIQKLASHATCVNFIRPDNEPHPFPCLNHHFVVPIRTNFLRSRRRGCVLSLLNSLNSAELGVALVEYGVNALQEGISENIKGHGTSGLNATVHHTVTSIRKAQVLLLNSELSITNSKGDDWKLIRGCAGREGITLFVKLAMRLPPFIQI